jgi:hypothetical protein
MKKDVSIIYRDIVIELRDDKFQIDGEDWSKKYSSLIQACEAIDRQLDVPFERVNVFWEKYGNEMFKGVATSITDSGEVWVSHPDKKGQWRQREKISHTVFIDNADNKEKYLKIIEIRKELRTIAEEYRNKVEEVKKTMQILNPKVMV